MQPRRLLQGLVLLVSIGMPYLHVYATLRSQGDRDALLGTPAWQILSRFFYLFGDPDVGARFLKGIPGWTVSLGTLTLTDPLAALGLRHWSISLMLGVMIPIGLTLLLGRYFCAWVCPAGFASEGLFGLRRLILAWGLKLPAWQLSPQLRYVLLALGSGYGLLTGLAILPWFYPPAVLGRELYLGIAMGQAGFGTFFLLTLTLVELLVMPRVWCRSLCPGGALYSLIARLRLLRIRRDPTSCIDCDQCVSACAFFQNPRSDRIDSDCTACGACVKACPTRALALSLPLMSSKERAS